MFAIANERKSLWQWDLNQQLTVAGDCTEVHYLDRGAPSTLTVEVKDGKADIPNILLQKAGRLVVYAYIIDAQDHHTKVCETFGIAPRPKPAEYVYTETEVKTWSDLQAQIGDLADLATDEKDSLVAAINEAAQTGGGGGAGAWYVTLTPDDDGNITADKTMAEIEAAYQAGYAVYCIYLYFVIFGSIPIIAPLTAHRANEQYTFCGVGTFDSKLYSFQFELKESGWTVLQKEIPQKSDIPAAYILPEATANALGGVKADPATANDTQPVRIDDSGKLVTAAGSGDISLGLTSAAVGQTIKVKTVDTHGRPTSWEAADMSGSGEVWEKVAEVTTTEEVASIELTLSDTCTKICVADNVPPFESSDGKQPSNLRITADDITVSVPTNYIAPHNLYPQTRSYWIIPLGDISWTFMTDALMNNPFRELAVKGNYADYSKTTISKIKYSVSAANSNRYMIPAGTKVTVYGVKK